MLKQTLLGRWINTKRKMKMDMDTEKIYSYEEIVSLLEKKTNKTDFLTGDYVIPELGESIVVEQNGGKGHDHILVVRHFPKHNVYVKLKAFYNSYFGIDFTGEDYKQVSPVTKKVVVFR